MTYDSHHALLAAIALAAACTAGIEVTDISDRIRQDRAVPDYVAGAIVRMVRINTPAQRVGVRVGDVIQAVGDQLIQNVCGFDRAIAKHACNDVRLTIRRGASTIDVVVPLSPSVVKDGPHFDDRQACQNGVPSACTALGKRHKQIDLFGLGCDMGDSEACYLFAVNAGHDHPGARAAYRQACDGGNSLACTNLGWMLQFGHGGRTDADEAMRLYRRGCEGSPCSGPNNVGCVNLARMTADPFESARIVGQVCERSPINAEDAREIAHACSLAGTASLLGRGTAKDRQRAVTLMEKGCDGGDAFGCFNLATLYDGNDNPRAIRYYNQACAAGDDEACRRLKTIQ